MSYILTHFWPGGTESQYRASVGAVHPPDGLPDGQRFHVAGPSDGGFLIVTTWDSKQQSDTFVNDVLMPAMPIDGGFEGAPEVRDAEGVNEQTA